MNEKNKKAEKEKERTEVKDVKNNSKVVNNNGNGKKIILKYEGEINNDFAVILKRVINEARRKGMNNFKLLLSSMGGSTYLGAEVYNYLKGLPISLEIMNYGSCYSMAVILFCAGKRRLALDNARFGFHGARFSFRNFTGELDEKALKELLKDVKFENNFMKKVLLETTSWTKAKISRMINTGNKIELTAKEAQKIGLVHEVVNKFLKKDEEEIDLVRLIEEEKIRQKILQQGEK